MKKLLTLAAAALLGLAGANQAAAYDATPLAPPVSALTSGKTYYIYDAKQDDGTATEVEASGSSRYAFRYDSNASTEVASADVYGTHVKPVNVTAGQLNNQHVWTAVQTADGTWTFQNVASQRYLANASAITTKDETARGYFDVETTSSEGTFTVKVHGTTNNRWDGNGGGNNNMVYWGGEGHPISFYEAVAEGDGYVLKTYNAWNVTYTFPSCEGHPLTLVVLVKDGENAANHIPAVDFFTPTGLAEEGDNAIVSEQQTAFTVTGSWSIPMAFEKVYRVRLHPGDGTAEDVKYIESENKVKIRYDGKGEEFDTDYFWYFKYSDFTNGVLKVTMHTIGAEDSKGINIGTDDNSVATLSTEPTTFIVKPTNWGSKVEGDFCLKHPTAENWINDRNPYFSTWNQSASQSGSGSVLRLSSLSESDFEILALCNSTESVDAFKANPTQTNLRSLNIDDAEEYVMIKNADAFAALGIASSEGVTNWNSFKENLLANHNGAFTETQSADIVTAYQNLVNSSANTPGGVHIKFVSNVATTDLMLVRLNNNEYSVNCLGSDVNGNKTTWTLKRATGGFYLYNEYSGKYINFPGADEQGAVPVSSESGAAIYVMDLFDAATARYGLKHVGDTEDHCYLHTNGWHNIVRWSSGANSSWYLQASDEATAQNEANIGADEDVANIRANFPVIGEGVGQYTLTADPNGAYASAYEQFLALTDASTNAEKHAAAAAVRAAYSDAVTCTLNMPQPGRFYRFQCVDIADEAKVDAAKREQHLFMSSNHITVENNSRLEMVVENSVPNKVETIFYLDENNRLVALNDGLCVGKFLQSNIASWNSFLATDEKVATVQFAASGVAGKYNIIASSGRYLYGKNNAVDCGGNDGAGYRWTITQVDWLPILGSDKTYTAFYSPVVLKNKDVDKMRANSVTVDKANGTASATAISGVVPANTPVLIEFTSDMDRDANNHLVYLEIDYNAVQAQAETADAASPFKGGIYATAKAEGSSYFTTQQDGEAVNFLSHNDTNVPGFASYIEVPTTEAAEKYTISDPEALGIEELSLDSKAGANNVIYDLQGRRVSKAVKGVYIINGKKVLVK